ncbi:MAG: hypothetical protein LBI13_07105 [Streptococcaceae bacterium]|jgi:hypothetical protein|nr:hypothetical protein [Streptococcaceae bacterium]
MFKLNLYIKQSFNPFLMKELNRYIDWIREKNFFTGEINLIVTESHYVYNNSGKK